MSRILIIEDDPEIRKIEKDYLESNGFEVVVAAEGKAGLLMVDTQKPDLVILDLNLPKMDGLEVCKGIRKLSSIPIIMVTARTKEIDESIGFDLGADDYIKKPFSPKIMVARVRALLKRAGDVFGEEILNIKDLSFDVGNYALNQGEKTITLTKIQYDILIALAKNAGRVLKRDELLDKGYKEDLASEVFDRTIDAHIKNIRKALDDNPKDPKYITTIRGVGYKFLE